MTTIEAPPSERDTRADQPAPEAASPPPSPAESAQPHELRDADFVWIAKWGAIIGTPLSFVVLAVLGLAATSWTAGILWSALWSAVMGGWYFGAIVVLAYVELRGRPGRGNEPDAAGRSAAQAAKR